MEFIAKLVAHGRAELSKVVSGQVELVDGALTALLCGGHILIEGVPGLGKTLTVKTLSRLLQLDFQRVQCTSDLMPADLLGTNVLNITAGTFALHRGPLFTDILLVDEINRMPPRTQASLLEAMEERQITLDGVTHQLSSYFTVLATQNPIEFEGTYPLPEAQLDRFLLKVKITYPSAAEEMEILHSHHDGLHAAGIEKAQLQPIDSELLAAARAELLTVKVEDSLFGYIGELVRRSRNWPSVLLGASPRAAISLLLVAKAAAAIDGRDYVLPDDVKQAMLPVLRHRLLLRPEAELEGLETDAVIGEILSAVEVPR